MIQNERFLALRTFALDTRAGDSQEVKETICLDYNNRACRHGGPKRDHTESGVCFIHCCLHCYVSSRDRLRCDHGLLDCKRKEKHNSYPAEHQNHYGLAPPPVMNQYLRPRFNPNNSAYSQHPPTQTVQHQVLQQPATAPPQIGVSFDRNIHTTRASHSKQSLAPRNVVALRSHAQPQAGGTDTTSGNGNVHAVVVKPSSSPASEHAGNPSYIDFSYIKYLCEVNRAIPLVDITPKAFAHHSRAEWPLTDFCAAHQNLTCIYETVRDTSLPNMLSPHIPVDNGLNKPAWHKYLTGVDDRLLDMICFGFPMGYIGPTSPTLTTSECESIRSSGGPVYTERTQSQGHHRPSLSSTISSMVSRLTTHDLPKV